MKKIIFVAFIIAYSVLATSCETESLTDASLKIQANAVLPPTLNYSHRDSVPPVNFTPSDVYDGPGDEVFPITPPKKK